MEMLQKSFVDPTMLYSHGITLRDKRFAYLKVEKNALLGRSLTQACIVMRTDSGKHAGVVGPVRYLKPAAHGAGTVVAASTDEVAACEIAGQRNGSTPVNGTVEGLTIIN